MKVAKGQLTGVILVDVFSTSLQSAVEKHDVLQLCTALLIDAHIVGTHKAPQALVLVVCTHDAEDIRIEENFADVFDREDVWVD